MANSEITVNDSIAAAFREINTDWRDEDRVASEKTEAFKKKALRPDILIIEPAVPPICLETEFEPVLTVEKDASSRLGQVTTKSGGTIQAAFAVKIPFRFKNTRASNLLSELRKAHDFQYCVLSGSSSNTFERWPVSGFVRGSIEDLFFALPEPGTPQHTFHK